MKYYIIFILIALMLLWNCNCCEQKDNYRWWRRPWGWGWRRPWGWRYPIRGESCNDIIPSSGNLNCERWRMNVERNEPCINEDGREINCGKAINCCDHID